MVLPNFVLANLKYLIVINKAGPAEPMCVYV